MPATAISTPRCAGLNFVGMIDSTMERGFGQTSRFGAAADSESRVSPNCLERAAVAMERCSPAMALDAMAAVSD